MTTQPKAPAKPYTPPFWHTFVAGGTAGIVEIMFMYPTDLVKTRAQLAVGQKIGLISGLRDIIQKEGFIKMYRGVLPPVLIEAPKRAIKFAANEFYKPIFSGKDGKLSQTGAIASGVAAGSTEAFAIVPFELVKIRLQDKASAGKYANTLDAVTKIAQTEGPLAFYKGLESTIWRHGVWSGGYFGLIFTVKGMMPKAKSEKGQSFLNFVAGAIAGTFGTMLNTPFDVAKSRIQNQAAGVTPKYNWTLPALKTIAQEEGFAALYKGFVPKVVRLGPGGGILLVVFEVVSKFLRERS
mmetsp:Transcript_16775/g.23338  ORF Transcript_16775/g.23338 Transcript_16775/m.23338 type:complete len:295 (-) Transcript_16775:109-993(-)|eukprot:CAMPEP_0168552064 /NCGR_PEP_ID=MMETSP0413-20121227/6518_1 /TAXON_ID=136452 /ORGANISM="Filamoeba nolandi, Strain NC-AS-23-1" /LENGTH=294 /DNA_ID=CAMNT_0008582655 /DNA_START=126 /DNA_END=1010 /DNA_ORIENTATION=-